MIFRRQVLRKSGIALAGTGLISSVAAAESSSGNLIEGGARENKPSKNVESTRVVPFPIEQLVPAGEWIEHGFGISTPENNSREFLEEELIPSLEVWIGGEKIDEPQQYLTEPAKDEDGIWNVSWAYYTPPKPVGEYQFKAEISTDSASGTYQVV